MKIDKKADNCPFIKTHYYPGKLLQASDLINDQEYINRKLQLLNRIFYGWGILEGLQVQVTPEGGLKIQEGSALDRQGRILLLPFGQVIRPEDIPDWKESQDQELVIGIQYTERIRETEKNLLEKQEKYEPARIEETAAVKICTKEEWKVQEEHFQKEENGFAQEFCLYQDERIQLNLEVPRSIPKDSIFKVCLTVQSVQKSVSFRGVIRLQGGRFLNSGHSYQIFEQKDAGKSGTWKQYWDIYTEAHRQLPLLLEVERLEIIDGKARPQKAENVQFTIEVWDSCAGMFQRRTTSDLQKEYDEQEDWIPLAAVRLKRLGEETYQFEKLEAEKVRTSVPHFREEILWQRTLAESGIADIRWRYLMKGKDPFLPVRPAQEKEEPMPTEESDKEKRIDRGVVIIPIPRRYKKGKILFSEEIAHCFPGREVFLQCGRIYEEKNYAYWEHTEKRYSVVLGVEDLFENAEASGWTIAEQAVRQNVNEGTFQIALTLQKVRRKPLNKEIAIAWTAYRIT